MVTALDEIVWAMNPKHDSLASLVSYFCLYADRFLGLANIAWRLEGMPGTPDPTVDSRHRHQLFLAFKEALTNVVRHADASEVRLSIQAEQGQVRLTVADNGRGFSPEVHTEEMDGVANMRARIEKLGGRFEITSEAGQRHHGTVLHAFKFMTKIAIVEDNKVIRESLMEFIHADPECRCVCTCSDGGRGVEGHSQTRAGNRADGHSIARTCRGLTAWRN